MVGYNLTMEGNVTNNGHSLQFTFTEGTAPYIYGGRLPEGERFEFAQLHWHWGSSSSKGSEHTLAGRTFPMEIHLVHWNTKYGTIGEAIKNSDGLAVLGFFYEISETDNDDLSSIVSGAEEVRKSSIKARMGKGSRRAGRADTTVALPTVVKLNQLITKKDTASYYYYQGGLTTPTCDESVLWTVFNNTVPVSEAQMEIFRTLKDSDGVSLNDNFRPPQPLNGRMVYANEAQARVRSVTIIGPYCFECNVTEVEIVLRGEETGTKDETSATETCRSNLEVSKIDLNLPPETFSWTGKDPQDPDDKLAGCFQRPLNMLLNNGGTLRWFGEGYWEQTLCVDWLESNNHPYMCNLACLEVLEDGQQCELTNCRSIDRAECSREFEQVSSQLPGPGRR